MQWGQIKTLFIISFLILDLFLLQQFLQKQDQSQLSQLAIENEETADELRNRGIEFSDDILNMDVPNVNGINSQEIEFSEEVLSQIETLDEEEGQTVQLLENETVLRVALTDPVEVSEESIREDVVDLVPFADQYSYWGYNEEENIALFFQKVNDRTVYFNQGGVLMVRVEEGQITEYVATLLSFSNEETEQSQGSNQLISPLNIILQLEDNGQIESGDEVTSMQVGYYSFFNLVPSQENGPQRFGPTWKVVVNGDEFHFLFATNGQILDLDESNFINRTIQAFDFYENENVEEDDGSRNIGQGE